MFCQQKHIAAWHPAAGTGRVRAMSRTVSVSPSAFGSTSQLTRYLCYVRVWPFSDRPRASYAMAQDTNAQLFRAGSGAKDAQPILPPNTSPMAQACACSTRTTILRHAPDALLCRVTSLQPLRSAILYIDMIQVFLYFREPHTSLRYPHVVVHVAQPQAHELNPSLQLC